MKKFLLLASLSLGLSSVSGAAWFGAGTATDYSQDANNMWYCASTGTVTTQAGVSLSSPTWSLYNPAGSNKNLVVLDIGVALMSSPAAAVEFSLAYNVFPSSGILVSTQSLVNVNGSTATITSALVSKVVASSFTLPTTLAVGRCNLQGILPGTPTAFRFIGGTTGASAIGGLVFADLTQGKVVVPPGAIISLQTSSSAAVQSHVLWREDPI